MSGTFSLLEDRRLFRTLHGFFDVAIIHYACFSLVPCVPPEGHNLRGHTALFHQLLKRKIRPQFSEFSQY